MMSGYYLLLDSGATIYATDRRDRALKRLKTWQDACTYGRTNHHMVTPRRVTALIRVTRKKATPPTRGRRAKRKAHT